MIDVYSKLKEYKDIILIDIGCHKAHFLDDFNKNIQPSNILYSIGVDPQDFGVSNRYSQFYNLALSNVDSPEIVSFNIYDEPGCSSLLEMNLHSLSRNRESHGWFCNHDIHLNNKITTNCIRASDLIKDNNFLKSTSIIHFVKIDAQGNDLNIIKSFDSYIQKCLFVQIESLVQSDGKREQMYKEQSFIEDDIKYFSSIGFEVASISDHSQQSCPEADVIFLNSEIKNK